MTWERRRQHGGCVSTARARVTPPQQRRRARRSVSHAASKRTVGRSFEDHDAGGGAVRHSSFDLGVQAHESSGERSLKLRSAMRDNPGARHACVSVGALTDVALGRAACAREGVMRSVASAGASGAPSPALRRHCARSPVPLRVFVPTRASRRAWRRAGGRAAAGVRRAKLARGRSLALTPRPNTRLRVPVGRGGVRVRVQLGAARRQARQLLSDNSDQPHGARLCCALPVVPVKHRRHKVRPRRLRGHHEAVLLLAAVALRNAIRRPSVGADHACHRRWRRSRHAAARRPRARAAHAARAAGDTQREARQRARPRGRLLQYKATTGLSPGAPVSASPLPTLCSGCGPSDPGSYPRAR